MLHVTEAFMKEKRGQGTAMLYVNEAVQEGKAGTGDVNARGVHEGKKGPEVVNDPCQLVVQEDTRRDRGREVHYAFTSTTRGSRTSNLNRKEAFTTTISGQTSMSILKKPFARKKKTEVW